VTRFFQESRRHPSAAKERPQGGPKGERSE